MVIVITIKYLVFVMRANNCGEGGILALMSLIAPPSGFKAGRNRKGLVHSRSFGLRPSLRRRCDYSGDFGAFRGGRF